LCNLVLRQVCCQTSRSSWIVLRGDEIYSSEFHDSMPDLVVVMNDGYEIHPAVGKDILSNDCAKKKQIEFDRARGKAASENEVLDEEEERTVEQHLKDLGYLS